MKTFRLLEGPLNRSPLLSIKNGGLQKRSHDLGYHHARRGHPSAPPNGVDVTAYNDGYETGRTAATHHAAGLMHSETPPSGPHPDYYETHKLRTKTVSPYFGFDQNKPIASSREVRADAPGVALGSWKIDSGTRLSHGRDIEQLGLFEPKKLVPSEFNWSDPESSLRSEGRDKDAQRYAEWIKAGHEPPPINVVQHENGSLRVTDGHRRLYASHLSGKPIKAWVSWITDHPKGTTDYQGNVLKTGLTHEIAEKHGLPSGVKDDGNYTSHQF